MIRINHQCRYLEEYPVRLLPHLEQTTGYQPNELLVLNMQYGMNYSGAGRVFISVSYSFSLNNYLFYLNG